MGTLKINHVDPKNPEHPVMWNALAALEINKNFPDPYACKNGWEVWQYMGTYYEEDKIVHNFRHRWHPLTNQREYRNIPASEAYLSQLKTLSHV